jgi:Tfp pilus assembly protein PilN
MTYSNSIAVSRQRAMTKGKNVTPFRARTRAIGPVSNTVLLVVLACLLGLLYLTQVTKTNAYGFEINRLETKQSQLKAENAELEVTAARLQALDRIKNSEVARGLVETPPSATIQN